MEACNQEWHERLSAWFDGEATELEKASIPAHLESCAGCARERERFVKLRAALRKSAEPEAAVSEALRSRVTGLAAPRSTERRVPMRRRLMSGIGAVAASLAVVWMSWPGGMNEALAMDLERHHLQAFSRSRPCDFESSDPEAVKAWIRREVGYDVEVPLVPGATLLGARRCRLKGQLAASLLYRHGNRAMTIFVPSPGSNAAKDAARFADEGVRCTQSPIGESICVTPPVGDLHAALAVSELEAPLLIDALGRLAR